MIVGDIDEEYVDVNACSYAKLASELEAVERRIGSLLSRLEIIGPEKAWI